MAEHKIRLVWSDGGKPFTYEAYPREHEIIFKDGQSVTASASPAYKGDGKHADPEDMLVAALSSCHMLSFLTICTKKKVIVQSYEDDAIGFLENDGGKLWITRVILRPKVVSSADAATLAQIHHMAHEACFIANSVKTDISVEPR
ncbi:MAG TPA: OsmC family protein [Rhizomicrobium sp.]|jgi:organic hydroperoxide reductase OsmC/OhrA